MSTVVRGYIFHQLIDLFQCESFCFGNENVGERDAKGAGRAPDEEDFDAQVAFVAVDYEGGYDADDEVPEPVA